MPLSNDEVAASTASLHQFYIQFSQLRLPDKKPKTKISKHQHNWRPFYKMSPCLQYYSIVKNLIY